MARISKKGGWGPGFLVTAAFIGPGTVTTCTLAGAHFGFSLLWALVFATLATVILQEMAGRLALGSGMNLAEALRKFPRSSAGSWGFILVTLAAITLGCAAYEAGNIIGGSLGMQIVSGIDRQVWGVIISATAVIILSLKSYRIVELILIALVFIMSVAFIGTAIIIKPDILGILKGSLPSFPANSLYLIIGLIGTTVVPYNLFLHSAAVKEKWKSKDALSLMRKDLWVAVPLGGLISIAIVITSAGTLGSSGAGGATGMTAADFASQLEPLFGRFAKVLFGIGFFAAGMSSAITAPYAAAFATSGVFGWKDGKDSPRFRLTWLCVILAGFTVSVTGFKPVGVIVFAQVANGLILPIAAIFLLLVLNNRKTLGPLANTKTQNALAAAAVAIVSVLGLWSIIKLFFK
jgi:NRAMP (natural resistance-associated macrophage protein)-like metal ion transporter